MRKLVIAIVMLAALGLAAPPAQASSLQLAGLAFTSSANPGVTYDSVYGPGWPPPSAVFSAGFDTTFQSTNALGTVTFTFSGAGTHYVAGFFDYQFVDVAAGNGLFDETVGFFGGLATGWSVQGDDSFGSSIYPDFQAFNAATPLGNYYVPGATPYDVAVALGYAVTLNAGDPDMQVIFTVGLTAPTSGSYFVHNDPLSGDKVYISGAAQSLGQTPIPEPGTLVLLALGLAVAGRKLYRRPS